MTVSLRYTLRFLNGELMAVSVLAVRIPNAARRWELGGGLEYYSAAEDAYSYWQPSATVRVAQEWPGGWITGIRLQAKHSKHNAPDPFFGLARKDTEGRIVFDVLNRKIRWRGFSPQLMSGYVKRDSNLGIYRYDRAYSRVGLSSTF